MRGGRRANKSTLSKEINETNNPTLSFAFLSPSPPRWPTTTDTPLTAAAAEASPTSRFGELFFSYFLVVEQKKKKKKEGKKSDAIILSFPLLSLFFRRSLRLLRCLVLFPLSLN